MSRQQTRKVIYAENNLPHAASNSVKLIVKMISFFSTLLVLYNKLIACKLHSFVVLERAQISSNLNFIELQKFNQVWNLSIITDYLLVEVWVSSSSVQALLKSMFCECVRY